MTTHNALRKLTSRAYPHLYCTLSFGRRVAVATNGSVYAWTDAPERLELKAPPQAPEVFLRTASGPTVMPIGVWSPRERDPFLRHASAIPKDHRFCVRWSQKHPEHNTAIWGIEGGPKEDSLVLLEGPRPAWVPLIVKEWACDVVMLARALALFKQEAIVQIWQLGGPTRALLFTPTVSRIEDASVAVAVMPVEWPSDT
jgi:hypothetical protein